MTAWVDNCPVCGHGLAQRGNRRVPIPWLGGKRKLVHAECAVQVERQATIDVGDVAADQGHELARRRERGAA